ncbi:MAG: YveK family protein [Anaeroplasma sp.]
MENHNDQENSITLNDLIGLVKKNILLIGLITFGVFLIGVFYTFKIVKPIYKSTTSVIVAIENQSNNADQNVDYTNSLRIIETVATYTKENVVLEPVAKKHNMSTNELKGMIETSTSTTKYIYTISISSENAELAGILVNEIYSSLEKQIDNNEAIKKFKVTVSQTSPALDGVYSKPNKTLYLIISLQFSRNI